MLHTRLVISLPLLALALSATLTLGQLRAGGRHEQDEQQVLDLTKVPAAARRSMGVPGTMVGGDTSGRRLGRPAYQLPLKVRLEGVQRQSPHALLVQIRLTNLGPEVFRLPSCVDELKAHQGGTGRRTFDFGVEFAAPNQKAPVREVADVTFYADSSPECGVRIMPGDGLVVRFNAPLPTELGEAMSSPEGPGLQVRATVSETRLKDNAFYIQQGSLLLQSENALTLTGAPPR